MKTEKKRKGLRELYQELKNRVATSQASRDTRTLERLRTSDEAKQRSYARQERLTTAKTQSLQHSRQTDLKTAELKRQHREAIRKAREAKGLVKQEAQLLRGTQVAPLTQASKQLAHAAATIGKDVYKEGKTLMNLAFPAPKPKTPHQTQSVTHLRPQIPERLRRDEQVRDLARDMDELDLDEIDLGDIYID